MVKMDLGSSDSQASSVEGIMSSRVTGYNSAITALASFVEATDLKGKAYSSAQSYGSSVLTPLLKGGILLSEGLSEKTAQLPSDYRSSVADESLDSDELQSEIDSLNSSIESYDNVITTLNGITDKTDQQSASLSNAESNKATAVSKRDELQKKLDDLLEFDGKSAEIFSDMDTLEQAVQDGLSQATADFSSFNGSFTVPSAKKMGWATTIQTAWEESETEVETTVVTAATQLAAAAGISYDEAVDIIISGKSPIGYGKKAVKIYDSIVKAQGVHRYINGRKIVVDSKGRVRIGTKRLNLYNRKTDRVYKRGKEFQQETGQDVKKSNIGNGVKLNGWKTALSDAWKSAKSTFKSSLKIWDDFDWRDASKLTKLGKVGKGLGLAGTVLSIGGNIKENFFDDQSSSVGEKIRNFAVDQGVDTLSGAGAAATGAAIGTMIGGPVGTVVGVVAGMAVSEIMNYKWGDKSVTDLAKDGLKGATDAIAGGVKAIAGWFS